MKALMHNYDGIADTLKAGVYSEPALVPKSPWLKERPARSSVSAERRRADTKTRNDDAR
jgi:hypothetical protein